MRNIYLIGMMGAGKTSVGRALARLANMGFVDLDEEIETASRLTINEIFQKRGEPYFRSEEKKALLRVALGSRQVVATGGGIVLDPENLERMRQTGRIVYLSAPFETLWERVKKKKDRPLLAVPDPKATFFQLFQIRRPLYEASSHARVETEGLSAEACAEKITEEYLK